MLLWSSPLAATTIYDGFSGEFLDYPVNATAYFNGDLIAGGRFSSAGGATGSEYLARWNGAGWVGMNMPGALSTGPGVPNGVVEVMTLHQGELFIGGHMVSLAGAPSDNIIRWDGTNWKGLRYGVNGPVYALLSSGNDLYVAGEFISASSVPANRVARWDGTNWNALGSGLNNTPVALAEYGGEIVAGGYFTLSGVTVGVAAWNGSTWHPLGQALGAAVHDLEVFNGILIAAGEFTLAGGSHLAWLDGNTWRPLGGGTDDVVEALAVAGSRLYIGGGFFNVGSGATAIPANGIAAWDGTGWSVLTTGVTTGITVGAVFDLASDGTNVRVAGQFEFAGDLDAANLAIWNGSAWSNEVSNYGNGLNGNANAFLTSGGSLVAGGTFTVAGGQLANRIARWDGTWHTYGSGFNGQVNALTEQNGAVIAGGSFQLPGSQPVSVAQWDGSSWMPFGSGFNGSVNALAIHNGQLIAGGNFTTAGGVTANRIARWDGTAWYAMGSISTSVQSLVVSHDTLFASGPGGLRKWNGTSWAYEIYANPVLSITSFMNDLVVSYQISCCGNQYFLSRWNGSTWTSMPSLPTGLTYLADYFGTLVGSGTLPSGEKGVVALDPTNSWYLLAECVDLQIPGDTGVRRLMAHDGSNVKGLFVGGNFLKMGGQLSRGIALINPEWKPTAIQEGHVPSRLQASPNPFRRSLAISFTLDAPTQVEVIVVDVQGRNVAAVLNQLLPAGPHEIKWSARDAQGRRVPPGVYFVRARYGDRIESKQVVLLE